MGGSTMGTTVGKHDSDDDGLSDTDTSDEEQPDTAIHIGRPKPTRRQSSHFVMRRAFKRYLFAKSPEVLIFHFKRFKQTHKTSMMFTSFYDLKK
jgi:ubiquitin carboxyl-terminal hydrolase 16/45